MKDESIRAVKVSLVLKKEQRIDADHWRLTFKGEPRITCSNHVVFFGLTIEDALNSIYFNEIKSICAE